jgi:beta-lactamase superfamily II metal-dependent hydrolase
MFRIEMLPARQGDALWIEYGDPAAPSRVLIDAGTPPTYSVIKNRILRLAPGSRSIELFIVTHIDTDHIGGALKLLADRAAGFEPSEVWFNAWRHLQAEAPDDRLGPVDGEILSELLDHRGLRWNEAFSGGPAVVTARGPLPACDLPGGMTLTLLSPGPAQLLDLRRKWVRVVQDAGLDPSQPGRAGEALAALAARKGVRLDRLGGEQVNVTKLAESPFVPDRAEANGSTIAVLAEFDGKSALLAGDGFAEVIAANVRRLVQERRRHKLAVDAVKLPHHGSRHNLNSELLSLLACRNYLFSTNGAIFGHPDREAVALVIAEGGADPTLLFNYRTEVTAVWDDPRLMRQYGYKVIYPVGDNTGLTVDL